jgi:maltooligosyltrehalose trehalohydrolase
VRDGSVHALRHGPRVHDDGTVTFRVWAPRATRVDLVADGRREEMAPTGRGWFARRVPTPSDERYAFSLDGGEARPDPASQRQPDGVHAASAVLDRAFTWSDAEARWQPTPLANAVIYELHVGTFTPAGTFDAAREHLAGLTTVGVTHVEVMPVAAANGPRGWGYDGVSWYAVQEEYGGPAAFAAFVDACHRHGLAVILDVVYNHFGPSGSYQAEFGPYLTDLHTTPWGQAVNLDEAGADAVRTFIVDNACMWLADFHVDGLRLDAVHALHDGSATHILEQLSAAVDRLAEQTGRPLALIAESDLQDPRTVTPRAAGGRGLTGQWLDDLHHALHATVTGERDGYYADYVGLPDVARAWTDGFVNGGRWSAFRQRTVGRPLPADVSGRRFVACIQNHDQIGNRAHGDRLTTLVDADRVRFAIALLCLSPTVPMLFMGEEYGETRPFLYFSSHPEEWLAVAVRTGRREEFAAFSAFSGSEVPDPQAVETFEASVLDHSMAHTPEGGARLRLWADLLRLRRSEPALATGDRSLVRPLQVSQAQLVVARDGPDDAPPVIIVANADARPATVAIPEHDDVTMRWSSTAASYGGPGAAVTPIAQDDGLRCTAPPWSVTVLAPPTT